MDVKEAVVRIFRFDPWVDDEPRYEIFRVPYREGDRILDVLLYIQENIDPTLAFRHSCNNHSPVMFFKKRKVPPTPPSLVKFKLRDWLSMIGFLVSTPMRDHVPLLI